jgi:hypothetical protein
MDRFVPWQNFIPALSLLHVSAASCFAALHTALAEQGSAQGGCIQRTLATFQVCRASSASLA